MKVFIVAHKSQNNTQSPWGRQAGGKKKNSAHTQALTNHVKSKVLRAAKFDVTKMPAERRCLRAAPRSRRFLGFLGRILSPVGSSWRASQLSSREEQGQRERASLASRTFLRPGWRRGRPAAGAREESCHFYGARWLSAASPYCPLRPHSWSPLCAFVQVGASPLARACTSRLARVPTPPGVTDVLGSSCGSPDFSASPLVS